MAVGFEVGHERLSSIKADGVSVDITRPGETAIDGGRRLPDRLRMMRIIVRFHLGNFGKRTDDERAKACRSLFVINTHPAHSGLGIGGHMNRQFPLLRAGLDRETGTVDPASSLANDRTSLTSSLSRIGRVRPRPERSRSRWATSQMRIAVPATNSAAENSAMVRDRCLIPSTPGLGSDR